MTPPRPRAPAPQRAADGAAWKLATVNVDAHVQVDGRLYSVPHLLVGSRCSVRLTTTTVEVFYDSCRVAVHPRSPWRRGYTTEPAHLLGSDRHPSAWTPRRILSWAAQTGPSTARLAEEILVRRTHPEQGFRACLALISLARRHGPERVEHACAQALRLRAHTYGSVKRILERSGDNVPATPSPARCCSRR